MMAASTVIRKLSPPLWGYITHLGYKILEGKFRLGQTWKRTSGYGSRISIIQQF